MTFAVYIGKRVFVVVLTAVLVSLLGCQRPTSSKRDVDSEGRSCGIPNDCVDFNCQNVQFVAISKDDTQSPMTSFLNQFRGVYFRDFFDRLFVESDLQQLFARQVTVLRIDTMSQDDSSSLLKPCTACNAVATLQWHDQVHRYPYTVPDLLYRGLTVSPVYVTEMDSIHRLVAWYDSKSERTVIQMLSPDSTCAWEGNGLSVSQLLGNLNF